MTDVGRSCAHCGGPLPDRSRSDRRTCSKSCRQARSRFAIAVGRPPDDLTPIGSRRYAYADPPYPGKSARYYSEHPDYAGEVDHRELIAYLDDEFDGWALSTAAESLPDVLALAPPGTRVAAWVRGIRPNKAARFPLNAWEPVLYGGTGIARFPSDELGPATGRHQRRDALVLGVTARTTDPARVIGAKPAGFARWIFDLLGALPGDELVDVFPGSGGIARAWQHYTDTRQEIRNG